MMDWMNSGPGQLDLTTPLLQGEASGQRSAALNEDELRRKDALQAEANRWSEARARLGLDEQQFQFQQNVYDAGAGLRAANLSEASARASLLQSTSDQASAGAPILAQKMQALSDAAASGNLDKVANFDPTIPGGSATQQSQMHDAWDAAKAGVAQQAYQKVQIDQTLNTAKAIQDYASNGGQVQQSNGKLIPTDSSMLLPSGDVDLGKIGAFNKKAALQTYSGQEQAKYTAWGNAHIMAQQAKNEGAMELAASQGKLPQPVVTDWKATSDSVNRAISAKAAALPGTDTTQFDDIIQSGNARIDGYRRQYVPLPSDGVPSAVPAANSPTTPPMSSAAAISTQAQYDALPGGSVFTWPDGKQYKKP